MSCPNNKELFEVSCTISDGFDVRINESCRKAYFSFIDFTNSFVWGDSSKVQMENPTGSSGVDVDQNFNGDCTNVKFSSTGGVKDSDDNNSWNLKVPLSDCSISSDNTKTDASDNKYTEYTLYWNSHFSDALAVRKLFQIGQVKLVCRVDSFQVSENLSLNSYKHKFLTFDFI